MLELLQDSMDTEAPLPPEFYDELNGHPEYGLELLQTFASQELDIIEPEAFFACLHFIELCLVQLRLAKEHHERWAEQHLNHYQDELVELMEEKSGSWAMDAINECIF